MLARALDYGRLGYQTISVNIAWNGASKKLTFPGTGWQHAGLPTEDTHPFIRSDFNALAILTGTASDVLGMDADHPKPGESKANGLELFTRLVDEKGLPDGVVVAKSGSGGRHYLFSLSKSLAAGLSPDVKGAAGLSFDGVKYTVDSRLNNNCLLCEPSAYQHPEGTRSYNWLTPMQHSRDLPAAPAWLIQYLNATTRPAKRPMPPTSDVSAPSKRQAAGPLVPCDRFTILKPLLMEIGFVDPRLTRHKDQGVDFVADRSTACACCRLKHDSNEWFGREIFQGVFVKSYSSRCRSRIVGFEAQRKIQAICSSPLSDAPYADVFSIQYGLGTSPTPLIWTGARWLYFQEHLWKPVLPEDVRELMQTSILTLLEQLVRWSKSAEVDVQLAGGTKEDLVKASERSAILLKAISHVRKSNTARNIIDALHSKMMHNVGEHPSGIPGDVELDCDPMLLGCDNGVVDLKTGTLRPGKPTDWVSKSVGYAMVPDDDGDAFVEETMRQIFPVDEEREYFQRYAGYCLLGSHAEKHYMLVTDMFGKRSGSNAKSTVSAMMQLAMGPSYHCAGIDASLYVNPNGGESENACTPGRVFYKGMRLATFEELDPKRRLNTTRLKNLHGGCATDTGRAGYAKTVDQFQWTAKFLITCNVDSLPDLNFEDAVHLQRLVILRGRAKFLPAAEYDALVDTGSLPPNTHRMDPYFKEKLGTHRSSILRWLLKGLSAYWTLGLQAPPIVEQWRQEISGQQDLVKEFVEENIVKTDNQQDFVKRSELYAKYKAATDEERDKKTALGKQKFYQRLLLELGEDDYHAQLKRRGHNYRDAFVGWIVSRASEVE